MGVGGCWAQSLKEEVFERFPFVDVAFGPGQVHKLAEFLTSDSLTAQGYFEFEGFTGHLPARRERPFQGWLQISVGCNCACSYCIVPSTRGREVSRPPAELVAEVQAMAAEAVREVTLLGQNVNSYGRDLPAAQPRPGAPAGSARERASFAGLLRLVDEIDGIERIRYTSPHPKDMREDVIRAHAELQSVCEHIHLPLQSGSSRILKAMRRTYDRGPLPGPRGDDPRARARRGAHHGHHRGLPRRDRGGLPADARSGGGGRLRQRLHVHLLARAVAPRRRAMTDGLVAHPVKVERMERLVEMVQASARERAQRFVGRTMEVLVEGPSRTDPDRLRGRTRHNKVVNFGGLASPGELTEVEILAATSQTLSGEERLLARAG